VTACILPPSAWATLPPEARQDLDVDTPFGLVVAIESNGVTVATCLVVPILALGAAWISPRYRRRGAAARALLRALARIVTDQGAQGVISFQPVEADVADYLERLGGERAPAPTWWLPLMRYARATGVH